MTMKFNVDGNNGKNKLTEEKETNSDELILDDGDDSENSYNSSSNGNNLEKAKLIKTMGIILVMAIVFILIMFLITSCTNGKKTYEEIEEIMTSAAESYFDNHQESLPQKDGGTQTVDVSVLVAEGKMKDLSKYTNATCTGSVKVKKSGSTYLYVPNLNCGEAYTSQELYSKVKEDNKIVSTGYGLYNKNGNYIFRGEKVNNYVQLDSALWRIVKITSGNNLVLVMNETLGNTEPWDNRFNQTLNYKAGINTYSSSRIKESLTEAYNTKDENVTSAFLSDKDKSMLVSFNLCTGKRALDETGTEQAVECREIAKDQKVGLLTAADYMNASIDTNCKSPSTRSCQNYNYLNNKAEYWLATANPANTNEAYMVTASNGIKVGDASNYAEVRPVVHLNTNVLYKSGSGTEEDPYIVK